MTTAQQELRALRGGLVVSCQAHGESVLRDSQALALIAEAAVQGGAVGIRADGSATIRAIRVRVSVPIIGIKKVGIGLHGEVFITPGCTDAAEVVDAGSLLVALDATSRPRPRGQSLEDVIRCIHGRSAVALADISTLDEALAAVDRGADMVGTTLSGYTPESPRQDEPDFDLLETLVSRCPVPVFAEGRISTPEQARRALDSGAAFVVVGTAITDPMALTQRFARALR